MKQNWTIKDLEQKKSQGRIRSYEFVGGKGDERENIEKKSGRAKYRNEKVEYDGRVFDSRKEYNRYRELLMLLKAGKIGMLELQVPYELNDGGTHSLKYIADFVYLDAETGEKIVEDVKGFRTRTYKKKCRLMKKIHNITIKEI